jgi:U4/U6 small nuclear ribonucleoprotein PRP31
MATLADELLNDFESGSENGDEENQYQDEEDSTYPKENGLRNDRSMSPGMELDGDEEETVMAMADAEEEVEARLKAEAVDDEDDTKAKVEKMKLGGVSDVRNVAGLMKTLIPVLDVSFLIFLYRSRRLQCPEAVLTLPSLLQRISHYRNIPPDKQTTGVGSVEDDPEYKLLTQSNSLATQIDSEIILVHKFIRDHYSTRFPELETLVANPLDYAKTVAILKNGPLENINQIAESSDNMLKAPLRTILDGPTLMVVKVEATQSRGSPLTDADLAATLRACEMTVQLDSAKHTLQSYVESRMTIFAPNLTILIGPETAAQLLNYCGGLTGLAKTPDRNIPAMGSRKQKQSGLATNVGIRQQGFLYHSELIQNLPTDLRIKGMRIVSGKLILAARVDSVHQSRDGTTGLQLHDDCMRRIEKLTEPPPNRGARALPAPDDKPARKRGGRRARKAKEANAMTDLKKQQNRILFGKEEREVGYGGDTKGLGMIGQENDGRIRATQVDRKTMAKLSKKNPGWAGSGLATSLNSGMNTSLKGFGTTTSLRAAGLRTSGVGGQTAGTASSVAFTPVQGLELIDPKIQAELKRKRDAENAGYFSSGTFTQVGGGKTDGAFKVPGLPPVKKTTMAPPPSAIKR